MRTIDLAAANNNNFLLPNGTFIVEVIIFFIVLFVFWKIILPPLLKAMDERAEKISKTAEDSQRAEEKLKAAQERYHVALAEARGESSRVREEARAEGTKTLAELRERAHGEVDAIARRGAQDMAAARARAVRELRGQVGEFSVTLAGRVLGGPLPETSERSVTIARFLENADQTTATPAGGAR